MASYPAREEVHGHRYRGYGPLGGPDLTMDDRKPEMVCEGIWGGGLESREPRTPTPAL